MNPHMNLQVLNILMSMEHEVVIVHAPFLGAIKGRLLHVPAAAHGQVFRVEGQGGSLHFKPQAVQEICSKRINIHLRPPPAPTI